MHLIARISNRESRMFIIIQNICPENKSEILKSISICDEFSVFSKENSHQTSHWLVMTGWITEKFIFKSHDYRSYFVLIFMFNFRVWTIKSQEFIQADLHFKSWKVSLQVFCRNLNVHCICIWSVVKGAVK